jgi:acyl-CoA dehydrogenase
MLGATANHLAEFAFRDVQLGPDAVLGDLGAAKMAVMPVCLALGRFSVAHRAMGMMRTLLRECVAHTQVREVPDGLLCDQPLVQQCITTMVINLRSSELMCADLARQRDTDHENLMQDSSMVKHHVATSVLQVADLALDIFGASGCLPTSVIGRFYRDAKPLASMIEGARMTLEQVIAQIAYEGRWAR